MPEKTFEEKVAEIFSNNPIIIWFDQQPEIDFSEDLEMFLKSAADDMYLTRRAAQFYDGSLEKGLKSYRKKGWVMQAEKTEGRADLLCRVWKYSDKERCFEFYSKNVRLSDIADAQGLPTADELLEGNG